MVEKRLEESRVALQHLEMQLINVACDDPGAKPYCYQKTLIAAQRPFRSVPLVVIFVVFAQLKVCSVVNRLLPCFLPPGYRCRDWHADGAAHPAGAPGRKGPRARSAAR